MSLMDLLLTVYDTFRQNKSRFVLTISGIMLGIALLILMASFLESGKKAMQKAQQEAVGQDVLIVSSRAVPLKDRQKTSRVLSQHDSNLVHGSSDLFGNIEITDERRITCEAAWRGKARSVSLVGVSMQAPDLYFLSVREGRLFTQMENDNAERVCLLGDEVAKTFAEAGPIGPGEHILIRDTQFRVVGILKSKLFLGKTSSLELWDRRIVIPLTTFAMSMEPGPELSLFSVRLLDPYLEKKHAQILRALLENIVLRHHEGIHNFRVSDPWEQDQLSVLIDKAISILFIGISALALLAGGINIMNIMLVTVSERTREIGIRLALGCTRRTLLRQFLLEAGLISMTGGVLGILLGIGLTRLLALIMANLWSEWSFYIDITSLLIGIVVSFAIGIMFGSYPALQATKLSPDSCLRYE